MLLSISGFATKLRARVTVEVPRSHTDTLSRIPPNE
jgi:hypothetical protein